MAYPNQDFGEAAPPDSGGHLGGGTTPDQLFDARRMDWGLTQAPTGPHIGKDRKQRGGVSAIALGFSIILLFALLLVPTFIW